VAALLNLPLNMMLALYLSVLPPSDGSMLPNRSMVPFATALSGICPLASQVLLKADAEAVSRVLSPSARLYFPKRFRRLNLCLLIVGPSV